MYKVLITTTYYGYHGHVSTHTAIAEFPDSERAVKAAALVNENPNRVSGVEQRAIVLF